MHIWKKIFWLCCAPDRNCPKLVYRCISILNDLNVIAPIRNWGKFEVETTVPQLKFLPQFRTGQNFKLGHQGKILFKPGHQCHQHQICPNSELGQYPTWGTSDFNFGFAPIPNWGNVQLGVPVTSTSDLPQFRTGAMSNLGHQCFNFGFAPIPDWGNVQLGAPVTSTLDLPQFRTGAMFNLGHQCFNFGFAPIPNWGNVQFGAPVFQLWTCPN